MARKPEADRKCRYHPRSPSVNPHALASLPSPELSAHMSIESLQPVAHLLQLILWGVYFFLHSLLATPAVKAAFARRWPARAARYPFYYSLLAVVLLLPVASLVSAVPGPVLWRWSGILGWLPNTLAVLALVAAWYAGRGYNLGRYLGVRDAAGNDTLFLGLLQRHVRHPWYALGLLVLWTRNMDLGTLVSALAITAYVVIGSRREERKLLATYGQAYRDYMARVPALLPRPGHSLTGAEAAHLMAEANQPALTRRLPSRPPR